MASWELWRSGDDGNPVMMKEFAHKEEAEWWRDHYEAKGHKQLYWVEESSDEQVRKVRRG